MRTTPSATRRSLGESFAEALAALAPQLPEAQREAVLTDALDAARNVPSDEL
jgi:hypothetical protein